MIWGLGKGKKGEGNKKYLLEVTNGHGGVKDSPGNVVSSIVVTTYSVRWVLDF